MSASRRSAIIDDVAGRLRPDFPQLASEVVHSTVTGEYDALIATRVHIRLYVPNLVEHESRERLTALTRPRTA